MNIQSLLKKYQGKIDFLDLELIIAHAINKPREFVLAHPEFAIAKNYESRITNYAKRRMKDEPLAYIFGEKEFYGLKFLVNKNVLIPRPETEQIVELVTCNVKRELEFKKTKNENNYVLIDIGTGSGNIIISIIKNLERYGLQVADCIFYGIDISNKALAVAKKNAKLNKADRKIKFLHGNLLEPIKNKLSSVISHRSLIIIANLPYLSRKIYASASKNVRKYEPKTALLSQKEGLAHYEELLKQIRSSVIGHQSSVICFLEISPEQKIKISKMVKKYFPESKIIFHQDLAGKWRICEINF